MPPAGLSAAGGISLDQRSVFYLMTFSLFSGDRIHLTNLVIFSTNKP
jgi:hypothetical protein